MTPADVAHILDIDTHRTRWPVVRWINKNISDGDADFRDDYKHLVEYVSVYFKSSLGFAYVINEESGEVESLRFHRDFSNIVEDIAHPTEDEMSLLCMTFPVDYAKLEAMCEEMDKTVFDRPHSVDIKYEVLEEDCCCCGNNRGVVNYYRGPRDWVYYCGGSPRCCP